MVTYMFDEKDANDLLDLLQPARRVHRNFYVFVNRYTTVTGQADFLHRVIVQLRVDGKHENIIDGSHGLFMSHLRMPSKRETNGYITCFTTFSCKSRVAPMMVTVSVFKSPPCGDIDECIAISSLSSVARNSIQCDEDCQVPTCPAIDDTVMWSENELEQFRNGPGYHPLLHRTSVTYTWNKSWPQNEP